MFAPALVPLRGGTRAFIVDHFAVGKAFERVALIKRMRGVVGDGVRKHPARAGRRFEAAITPARIQV